MSNYKKTGLPGKEEVIVVPLGGCGEIGMNMTLYGHDGKWIMVDCGVTFPDEHTPGVDLIMPDPSFILDRIDDLAGVVITHAHEDHIGALPFLSDTLECPVFASPFAHAVLQNKLNRQKRHANWQTKEYHSQKCFTLGPFTIHPIAVTHSTIEAHALSISTACGKIVHTGDWKIDHSPLHGPAFDITPFEELGKEGVLACLCDSTNIFETEASKSERDIRESLTDLVGTIKSGRVAVTCFASNIVRIESAILAARKAKREVTIIGASMVNMIAIAKELGVLHNLPEFVPAQEAMSIPKDKLLMVVAGCQGEPQGSMTRVSEGSHRFLQLHEGDTAIFSSREIPGNEKALAKVYSNFTVKNVKIIQSSDNVLIHGSGHASKVELTTLHEALKPHAFIPIHGEFTHLYAHRKVAHEESGILHAKVIPNGDCASISQNGIDVVDNIPSGRWFIDGGRILELATSGHRQRRTLSFKGAAFLSFAYNKKRAIISRIEVSLFGLGDDDNTALMMKEWCHANLPAIINNYRGDSMSKHITSLFKKELYSVSGHRAIVHVHCFEV